MISASRRPASRSSSTSDIRSSRYKLEGRPSRGMVQADELRGMSIDDLQKLLSTLKSDAKKASSRFTEKKKSPSYRRLLSQIIVNLRKVENEINRRQEEDAGASVEDIMARPA